MQLWRNAIDRDPERRFPMAHDMALALEAAMDIARPSEIGAWTERVAAESLRERKLAVERSESAALPSLPAREAAVDREATVETTSEERATFESAKQAVPLP